MTRSEAIQANIFLMEMAAQHPKPENGYKGNYNEDWREMNKVALDILLAEQKRSEGCDYCKHHGNPSAVVWDAHKIKEIGENEPHKSFMSASMYTRKGEGELRVLSQSADNKQNQIIIPARFCLNCGRDLTEGESV